eukprot:scaffold651696_cov50-Prasinocladus_malaysianus.AAC.1
MWRSVTEQLQLVLGHAGHILVKVSSIPRKAVPLILIMQNWGTYVCVVCSCHPAGVKPSQSCL